MATTVTGAVERRDDQPLTPSKMIAEYRGDIARLVPSHVDADAYIRVAQGVMRRADPKLIAAYRANPGSLMTAVLDCAQLGLRPGDTYHFVPIGGRIQGIPDYTGEIELMYRTNVVASVKAEIVYSNDRFTFRPDMDRPHHEVEWWGERGEMVGGYAYAIFTNGATSRVVVMTKDDIHKRRDVNPANKSGGSIWIKWPVNMWLKTLIHQLRKWTPSSPEYLEQALRAQKAADVAEDRGLPVQITGVRVDDEEGPPLPSDDEAIEGELVESAPAGP